MSFQVWRGERDSKEGGIKKRNNPFMQKKCSCHTFYKGARNNKEKPKMVGKRGKGLEDHMSQSYKEGRRREGWWNTPCRSKKAR